LDRNGIGWIVPSHMRPATILWMYILLLVGGGLAGYLKAKSKISLYLALGFAVALSLCALGHWARGADELQVVLLFVFGWRWVRTKKLMPAGLLLVITLVTLALRHLL
jgi:uncharacterized membrane protein (UPF0136 family)